MPASNLGNPQVNKAGFINMYLVAQLFAYTL